MSDRKVSGERTDRPDAPPERPENFEAAIEELERIVESLERGELSLDASVSAFQRGTALVAYLTEELDAAEKRVKVLIERAGETLDEEPLDEEGGA
jgi:exodeoxyribonuclease VII small subunit